MADLAVSVQNLSKKFRLFDSPGYRLLEAFHPFNKTYHREFWALKDVSFEVEKGTTLGIIGLNGSGKSTLLQLICSVLQPTVGTVEVNGRISALLELGADFNPEFTGRENVMMKGISMGFSKKEMKKQLPQIEDFAQIGAFIDQPVKTYSSGMFVRLAFATAINVEPDILVVDEALAVGDAKFQHKCYLRFKALQETGVTVILVTHDLEAVLKHCGAALLLNGGRLQKIGSPHEVTTNYREFTATGRIKEKEVSTVISEPQFTEQQAQLSQDRQNELDLFYNLNNYSQSRLFQRKNYNAGEVRIGGRECEIIDYLVCQGDMIDPVCVNTEETIDFFLKVLSKEVIPKPCLGFTIKTTDGSMIYGSNTDLANLEIEPIKKKKAVIFKFSTRLDIASGDYFITIGIGAVSPKRDHIFMDSRHGIIHLKVEQKTAFDGVVRLDLQIERVSRDFE